MILFHKKKKTNLFKKKERKARNANQRLGGPPLLGSTAEFGKYNRTYPVCAEIAKQPKIMFFAFLAQTERIYCKVVPENPQNRKSVRGQTKTDEARVDQLGKIVSCGRAGPAKSMPALSLLTVPFTNPPPATVSFSKTNSSSAASVLSANPPTAAVSVSSSRTKIKSGRRKKLRRSSIGAHRLQLSAEEKPEFFPTKKGTQATKAEKHLINPILLPLLESLCRCPETGDSVHPLHAPTELQLPVQDVEAGPRSPLVAFSSSPGGRDLSASAVNPGVPLFEEDISDYMRRVGDELELEQEHQAASVVDDEESATALSDT